MLAAQRFRPQAVTLAESRGMRCVEVDLAVLRGEREPELTLFTLDADRGGGASPDRRLQFALAPSERGARAGERGSVWLEARSVVLDNTNGRAKLSSVSTTKKRRADGDETRATILDAATRLATVEGLDGLSIGRLADHIGMSKSGLYAHFGSKEELQLAAVDTAAEIFTDTVIRPARDPEYGVRPAGSAV